MLTKILLFSIILICFSIAYVNLDYLPPTPANASVVYDSPTINLTLNSSSLSIFFWNWNSTHYPIYDRSLLLHLQFDNLPAIGDASNNLTDISHYNRSGLCYDSTNSVANCQYVQGKYGNALEFTGTNSERFEIPDDEIYDGFTEMTLAVWIYPLSGMSSWNGILSKSEDNFGTGNSWALYREGTGGADNDKITFLVYDSMGAYDIFHSSETLSSAYLNNWTFVVVTWNGSNKNAQFYKNGVTDGTAQTGSNVVQIRAGDHKLRVGKTFDVTSWKGYIDEVKIINRTLNSSEIYELYESTLNKISPTDWHFLSIKSNLSIGSYQYYACANDSLFQNCTDTRILSRAPSISSVSSTILTSSTVHISWLTNSISNSSVKYGTSIGSLTNVVSNATDSIDHLIALDSLIDDTLYYYNVTSCSSGLCRESGPFIFSTSLFNPILEFKPDTPENASVIATSSPSINVSSNSYLDRCTINGTQNAFDFGNSEDGLLNVTESDRVINNYSAVSANIYANTDHLIANDISFLNVGDEILILQMQNHSAGIAGTYEFKKVSTISGNTVYFSENFVNNFYSGSFNSTTATSTQLVKVPHYDSVIINDAASITALPWNGYVGGIVALKSNISIIINGKINVSAKGFRGGTITLQQGESYAGLGSQSTLANMGAGGGGFSPFGGWGDEANGGGGGYSTYGSSGGLVWGGENGSIYGSNSTVFLLGSGGGAGGQTGGGNSGGYGGAGGGIIFLSSSQLIISGNLISNGGFGVDNGNGGSGGGGSGGSLILFADSLNLGNDLVNATGGLGGIGDGFPAGNGGNGGAGRIKLYSNSIIGNTNPLPYAQGLLINFTAFMDTYYDNQSHAEYFFTGLPNATYNYTISCTNLNGNTTTTNNRQFIIDTSYPYIELLNPLNNSFTSSTVQFSYVFTNRDNSNLNCSTYLDGVLNHTNSSVQINTPVDFEFSSISEGLHLWNVSCTTPNNNTNRSQTNFFITDLTSPEVLLSFPNNNTQINSNTVQFNFSTIDSYSTTLNCSFNLDNVLNQTNSSVQNNTNTSFTINNIADGNHLWNISCFDLSGNIGNSSTYIFSVNSSVPDTLPPLITLNYPSNNSNYSLSNVTFNFTATDDRASNLDCVLYLDNLENETNSSVLNNTPTLITVSEIADGIHNWNFNCSDSYENSNISETRTFVIDTTPPIVNLFSPEPDSVLSSNISFNFTAIDNLSAILSCTLKINGINAATNSSTLNNTPTIISVSGFSDGAYAWNVSCIDLYGNPYESAPYNFTVDNPPNITLASPNDGDSISSLPIDFEFSAIDASPFACSLIVDELMNSSNSSVSNDTATVISLPTIAEGTHIWYINCTDENLNSANSPIRSFTFSTSSQTLPPSSSSAQRQKQMSIFPTAFCNYSILNFSETYPLSDVRVVANDALIGYTNSSGSIKLNFCGSKIKLYASLENYQEVDESFQLPTCSCDLVNSNSSRNSSLEIIKINQICPSNQLKLKVFLNGFPVPNVTIISSNGAKEISDKDGITTFMLAENGTYFFSASLNDFINGSASVDYSACSVQSDQPPFIQNEYEYQNPIGPITNPENSNTPDQKENYSQKTPPFFFLIAVFLAVVAFVVILYFLLKKPIP